MEGETTATMGIDTVANSTQRLMDVGAVGAVLVLLFLFIFFFLFKYYLPQQTRVQLEKVRLESENQANKDKYNQAMMQQVMDILKDTNNRRDVEAQQVREENSRSYELQREFFRQESEAHRQHSERIVEHICDGLESVEKTIERNSMMVLALAESQGRSKEDLLRRVETLTGESGLQDKYKTRGDWEDPSGSGIRERKHVNYESAKRTKPTEPRT